MRRISLAFLLVLAAVFPLSGCGGGQKAEEKVNPWHEIVPGLSYVDSTLGQGALCEASSFVEVHYTGYLWQADEKGVMGKSAPFESSVGKEPIAFSLGRSWVIEGWEKGLVGMAVGGKRSLLVEPDLAYGPQGRPPLIPPGTTLFFDVELVGLPRVQVEILEEGTGPVAQLGDRVSVEYTGWLWIDGQKGKQFDTSASRGRPHQFALGFRQVIPGWDRAIEGMKVGTRARLIIPPSMGYGSRGSGGRIPPNSTLCFEIELVGIDGK